MMLEQIEKKHQKLIEERVLPPKPTKAKVVGVKVEPNLYQQLAILKERRKLGSIKEAVLMAIREGLRYL